MAVLVVVTAKANAHAHGASRMCAANLGENCIMVGGTVYCCAVEGPCIKHGRTATSPLFAHISVRPKAKNTHKTFL